ncbi:hypothetical protein BDV96DRAFT_577029 [Lophiotrema nucula]|uniref:B30.2/SPRY domain-containing protein n=1 Tax=Lophiotrema nucula TaxID=690887 RepID=A0A6A5Z681_9PLEO|nr:hypothetical protein BDV96DRAFT_577029 [Lophiotrema nucula]
MSSHMLQCLVALLLCFFPRVSSAAGDDGGELGINLFTDLAPLLALFGEQFARQFMSESLLWLDHVIFAMVPLGILTAIIGAIRVSGPSWARAFIGRARESRAVAEIELMSSTSGEVCEVYNGKAIVRAMGKPALTQLILLPGMYTEDDNTCGIYTLQAAYNSVPPLIQRGQFGAQTRWDKWSQKENDVEPQDDQVASINVTKSLFSLRRRKMTGNKFSNLDVERGRTHSASGSDNAHHLRALAHATTKRYHHTFPSELDGSAPNLQLNLPTTVPSYAMTIRELWCAAIVGVMIQAGVIAVGAVVTYQPFMKSKFENDSVKYGFPLFASGTVCLNAGMMICSWVIERSTQEHVWRRTPRASGIVERGSELDPSKEPEARVQGTTTTSDHKGEPSSMGVPNHDMAAASSESLGRGQFHLFWLQRKHTVNDQAFDSFLILGGSKDELLTSSPHDHRSWNVGSLKKLGRFATNLYELSTVGGAAIGIVGFILQFEGLRGLPWPTAVAQLFGIVLMALIRAFVRRRLGERCFTHTALDGYELEWLAQRLVYEDFPLIPSGKEDTTKPSQSIIKWQIATKETGSANRLLVEPGQMRNGRTTDKEATFTRTTQTTSKVLEDLERCPFPRNSQTVLKIRQRLGQLANRSGVASKEAVALSRAITLVLDEIFPIHGQVKKVFSWFLKARTLVRSSDTWGEDCDNDETSSDKIELQALGNERGWNFSSQDADAVLSLWLSSFADRTRDTDFNEDTKPLTRRTERDNVIIKYRRILGENPTLLHKNATSTPTATSKSARTDVLTRDLNWWVRTNGNWDEIIYGEDVELVLGFNGMEGSTPGRNELSIDSSAARAVLLAQHIFSAFIWALSPLITSDTFDQAVVEDSDLFIASDFERSWMAPTLRNARLIKIARGIESFGLGSFEDILLCMVPPLSCRGLLPNEEILTLLLDKARYFEKQHAWSQSADVYLGLLGLYVNPQNDDRVPYEIVVDIVEFLFVASEAADDRNGRIKSKAENMNAQALSLAQAVERVRQSVEDHSLLLPVLLNLRWFYMRQGRQELFNTLFPKHEIKGSLRKPALESNMSQPNAAIKTMIRFTEFHDIPERLKKRQKPLLENEKRLVVTADIFGWTPLHYAIVDDYSLGDFQPLLEYGERYRGHYELKDRSGRTPLHYAVIHDLEIPKLLINRGGIGKLAATVQARDGSLPVHVAARHGRIELIKMLEPFLHTLHIPDHFGRTPLHLGAIRGYSGVIDRLYSSSHVVNPSSDELSRRNVLHLALAHNHDTLAQDLITRDLNVERLSSVDTENVTPIDLILGKGEPDFMADLLAKFPEAQLNSQKGPNAAATCLTALIAAAIASNRAKQLSTIFQAVLNRSWDERLILEAFSIVQAKDKLEMLPELFEILRELGDAKKSLDVEVPVITFTEAVEDAPAMIGDDISNPEGPRTKQRSLRTSSVQLFNRARAHVLKIMGTRILNWAIRNGDDDLFSLLVEEPASGNGDLGNELDHAAFNQADNAGDTLLASLALSGLYEAASVEQYQRMLQALWRTWTPVQKQERLNSEDRSGRTPLMLAASCGSSSLVQSFLEAGADPRIGIDKYRSALELAMRHQQLEVCKILLDHDPALASVELNSPDKSPLMVAVKARSKALLQILGRYEHVEANIPDIYGVTPLTRCLLYSGFESTKILVDTFPHIDSDNYQRDTLLSSAVSGDENYDDYDDERIRNLLKLGANPLCVDSAGRPQIFLAAVHGNIHGFELVQEAIGDEVGPDYLGLAFHGCAQMKGNQSVSRQIVDRLFAKKADPNVLDRNGWTAHEVAKQAHNYFVQEHLQKYPLFDKETLSRTHQPSAWAIDSRNTCFLLTLHHEGFVDMEVKRRSSDAFNKSRVLVRSNHCIPFNKTWQYWELQILGAPRQNEISIGLCTEQTPIYTVPGWPKSFSYGYAGSSGTLFRGRDNFGGSVENGGDAIQFKSFAVGDTVGCCVRPALGTMFFTLNGAKLGSDIDFAPDLQGQLYPCVGFCADGKFVGSRLRTNFGGKDAPSFMYTGPFEPQDEGPKTATYLAPLLTPGNRFR